MNYLKPFVVRAGGTFETRLRDVEARLQIVATVQFLSAKHAAALLSLRPDVSSEMAEAIDSVVRERMRAMRPERFYMRFIFTDEHEARSAETELTQLIAERLSGDPFHARVLNLVLKLVETDLIHRFRELQEAIASFAVTVEPSGIEPMEFQGELRVVAVDPDGWHTFRALAGGIEQITALIRDQLLTLLQARPVEELRYYNEDQRAALQADVSAMVAHYAREQFGLVVEVSGFRRAPTFELLHRDFPKGEQFLTAGSAELTGISKGDERWMLARVERLLERRNALLATGDDELDAVEEEIAALRRRLDEARGQPIEKLSAAETGTIALLESNTRSLGSPSADMTEATSREVSAFDIALSMDLEGPPDWSERIDHYLYGVDDGK